MNPRQWLGEAERLDLAVYEAVARTGAPGLDRALRRLSNAANHSALWLAISVLVAAAGGERGRRAAADGVVSIAATSAVVNGVFKPIAGRRRPDPGQPAARHVPMPATHSFPSGHSASAFAFATGVAHRLPRLGAPLRGVAALVAYSRVHTGVHFPGDVVAGSLLGAVIAHVTTRARERLRS